jgi:hypothetical protein
VSVSVGWHFQDEYLHLIHLRFGSAVALRMFLTPDLCPTLHEEISGENENGNVNEDWTHE